MFSNIPLHVHFPYFNLAVSTSCVGFSFLVVHTICSPVFQSFSIVLSRNINFMLLVTLCSRMNDTFIVVFIS